MNIDISAYRASIGSYYFKYNRASKSGTKYKLASIDSIKTTYKYQFHKSVSYKYLSYKIVVLFIIFMPIVSLIHSSYLRLTTASRSELFNSYHYGNHFLYNNERSRNNIFCSNLSKLLRNENYESWKLSYNFTHISNFQSKYTYGNRQQKGITLCHWNKSNAKMKNRMFEIKHLILEHRPTILGISEANINISEDMNNFSISDYQIFLGPVSSIGVIRLAVYVHNSIKATVRQDLFCQDLNSIWLEVSIRKGKK